MEPLLLHPGMTNHSLLGPQVYAGHTPAPRFLTRISSHACPARLYAFKGINHLTFIFLPTGTQWALSKHWPAGGRNGKPDPA